MPRLEYVGGHNPFHDINAYKQRIKKAYPGISDVGINQAIKKSLDSLKVRRRGYTRTFFGRDIMTEDPAVIPAWAFLPPSHRKRIREHPLHGGSLVNPDDPKYKQVELASAYNRASVNRSVLISPKGLENTYVWCQQNNWTQELTQEDYDLLMQFRNIRWLFQDPDVHGLYKPVRSYEAPVLEKHVARDMGDVKALMRQYERKEMFPGFSATPETKDLRK